MVPRLGKEALARIALEVLKDMREVREKCGIELYHISLCKSLNFSKNKKKILCKHKILKIKTK